MPNFSILRPDCTKDQAAQALYPNLVYDTALPQPWVNEMLAERAFDVRPHFVWGYPSKSIFGRPFAISQAGQDWLEQQTDLWLAESPV